MPKKKRGSHDEDSLQYLRKKMEKLQKKLEKCDKAHRRLSHHKRSGSPRPLSRSRSPVIEGKRLRSRSRSRSSRRRRRRRATSPSTPPAPAPPTPRRRARRPRSRTPPPAHRRRSRTPRSRSRSRHSLRDCSRRQNEGTHEQAECHNTKVVQSSQNVITQMNVDTPQEAVPSSVAAPAHVDENVPTTVTDDAEPTLDSTILEILGDDPAQNSVFGPEIQKDLALRLEHCATNGLSKENRQDLKNKYLLPSNCKLINAPVLNAEITAALTDPVMKRVKAIELRQQHLASAISALSQALTRLMAEKDKDHDTIKYLMDASRILCDCQYSDSMMRRFFVLTNLKKDLKNQLQQTKIDNLLFGENFAETLRTAKAINKSGSDLKVTAPPKPRPRYTNKNPNPTPGPSKPLNWRGPNPPRSRQVETPRTREPAARGARQWTSSKPSQHPPRRNTRR